MSSSDRIDQQLSSANKDRTSETEIALVPVKRTGEGLPLSSAQGRLWFLDQLEPNSSIYNISLVIRFYGTLDLWAFKHALEVVIKRHEILRTTFAKQNDQPVQIFNSTAEYGWILTNLEYLPEALRGQEALHQAQQEFDLPFNLAHGPLLRCKLLRLAEQDHVVVLTMHSIIFDKWSSTVLLQEIANAYAALHSDIPLSLPELPIQYADYAVWEHRWLQGDVQATQRDYWKRQLTGVQVLDLPTDHPRPHLKSFSGAQQTALVPKRVNNRLREVARQEGVTLFMLLLTSFQILLSHYSGQMDIVVGTPVGNRLFEVVERLIGPFVNIIVIRVNLSNNPSFHQVLEQVREQVLEAYMHQNIPIEQVIETLQPERDLSRSPLFQVLFSMQLVSPSRAMFPDLTLEFLEPKRITSQFDLSMFITETEHSLKCTIDYSTDLFESRTIIRFLEHWQVLLEKALADTEQHIEQITQSIPRHFSSEGHAEAALNVLSNPSLLSRIRSFFYNAIGKALSILGFNKEALIAYEHSILLDPHRSQLYMRKGEILFNLKRYQEALAVFDVVIRQAPESSEAYREHGKAYEQLAQQYYDELKQRAQQSYDRAKELEINADEVEQRVVK